mmetsp:Transcript_9380/g.11295  ORF Transcript_9380/g.11295 Transcript_9380/m.11295 type:complete len:152 (+) Transcript_9380:358-813(+)
MHPEPVSSWVQQHLSQHFSWPSLVKVDDFIQGINPLLVMVRKSTIDRMFLLNHFKSLCPNPVFTWAKKHIEASKVWPSREEVDEYLSIINPLCTLLQKETFNYMYIFEVFQSLCPDPLETWVKKYLVSYEVCQRFQDVIIAATCFANCSCS